MQRSTLSSFLLELANTDNGSQIDPEHWDGSPYRPVPTIIEAAELLYAGHQVADIAHAISNPENLTTTTDRLIEIVADAQRSRKHVVVFVTGVPGSGKTLVGLNAIHDPRFRAEERPPGAFLSGIRHLLQCCARLWLGTRPEGHTEHLERTSRSQDRNSGAHDVP